MAELEEVMNLLADKIAELEAAQANLKRERDKMHVGYQRLSEKNRAVNDKAE
jgi:prefoldin subunit 5